MERSMNQQSNIAGERLVSAGCEELVLEKGQFYRIDAYAAPVQVTSRGAVVWVTRDNDIQDYVLERDQSVTFIRPGRVLVEALRDGKICLTTG